MEEKNAASEMEAITTAKQRSLAASFEAINSKASSILEFSLDWKALEDHFNSARTEIKAGLEELGRRVEAAAEVDAEAARLTALVERRREEALECEGWLESVRALVKENEEELKVREERYEELARLIREKEREAEEAERCVKEKSRKLSWTETRITLKVKEVAVEEERLIYLKAGVAEWRRELVRVDDEVAKCRNEVEVTEADIRAKAEELARVEAEMARKKEAVVEFCREVGVKEGEIRDKAEELVRVEDEVAKCRSEVEVKMGEISTKAEELVRVEDELARKKEAVAEFCREVEVKEGDIRTKVEELRVVVRELDGKEERLRFVEEAIGERCRMMDAKREELSVVERMIEKWCGKVEVKEREMEGVLKKVGLMEKEAETKVVELDFMRDKFISEIKLKESHLLSLEKSLLEQKEELLELQKSVDERSRGSKIPKDGRGLQLFMNESLKRIDSLGTELSAILRESSNPEKLVLDAMHGFYPVNKVSDFELRVRRRSCCLLLEELMRMSLQVNPLVKQDAANLAECWKAKLTVTSDGDLECLGFLRLVAAYGLTSSYDVKELRRLLSKVSHGQQAAEIGRDLGIMIPGSHISTPVIIDESESSATNNAAAVSSPNQQSSARNLQLPANGTTPISSLNPLTSPTADVENVQGSINVDSSWNLDEIQTELVASVRKASDSGRYVLALMQNSLAKCWRSSEEGLRKGGIISTICLLKELMRISPQIGSPVKEDAKKLGLQWKEKIKAAEHLENHLEIVGFLLFLVVYGLVSTLNRVEIVKLLERLSQHEEALGSLQMHCSLGQILEVFIQAIVEGKQLFQALGFVFKFKLLGNFNPTRVLKDYVKDVNLSETLKRKNSDVEKVVFIDSRIVDLKAVLRCIKEYNLDSEYPPREIEAQIGELEKLKEICRNSEKCFASITRQQEVSRGQKRSSNTSPEDQQGQHKNKFHRAAEASSILHRSRSSPTQPQPSGSRPSSHMLYTPARYTPVHLLPRLQTLTPVHLPRVSRPSSSLATGQHPPSAHVAANWPALNPRFDVIDEGDPRFGVPTLPDPHPFMEFAPFPGLYRRS